MHIIHLTFEMRLGVRIDITAAAYDTAEDANPGTLIGFANFASPNPGFAFVWSGAV